MKKILNSPLASLLAVSVILILIVTLIYKSERMYNMLPFSDQINSLTTENDTLRILSFASYFPTQILDNFEASTGVHIDIETFDSPTQLQQRVESDTYYDIIVVNDYLVDPFVEAGHLVPIEHNRLTNFGHIDDRFRAIDYDYGNQHSVPFLWGTVGLSYNSHHVVGLPLSWDNLLHPDHIEYLIGRISILDDYRVTMGILLMDHGFDPNTNNEDEIELITDHLLELVPYLAFEEIESIEAGLLNDEVYLSMMWSGDAALLSSQKHDIRYSLPSEGTIFWVDNLTISSQSEKVSLSYQFIDHVLTPRVIAEISNLNYHANPVTNSRRYIDRNILNGPAYANPYVSGGVTMINHIGDNDTLYQKYWDVFTDSLVSWQQSMAEQVRRP